MKKPTAYSLAVLPVLGVTAALGLAIQQGSAQAPQKNASTTDSGYVCPLTGETLPCPGCCPANK